MYLIGSLQHCDDVVPARPAARRRDDRDDGVKRVGAPADARGGLAPTSDAKGADRPKPAGPKKKRAAKLEAENRSKSAMLLSSGERFAQMETELAQVKKELTKANAERQMLREKVGELDGGVAEAERLREEQAAKEKEERIELLRRQIGRRMMNQGITRGFQAWMEMWEAKRYALEKLREAKALEQTLGCDAPQKALGRGELELELRSAKLLGAEAVTTYALFSWDLEGASRHPCKGRPLTGNSRLFFVVRPLSVWLVRSQPFQASPPSCKTASVKDSRTPR